MNEIWKKIKFVDIKKGDQVRIASQHDLVVPVEQQYIAGDRIGSLIQLFTLGGHKVHTWNGTARGYEKLISNTSPVNVPTKVLDSKYPHTCKYCGGASWNNMFNGDIDCEARCSESTKS